MPTWPENSVHCVVTSPPYFRLRDYGVAGQIGLETDVDQYIDSLVKVFREVRRVLRPDGTLWLNIGDTYCTDGGHGTHGNHARQKREYQQRNQRAIRLDGIKPKDMIGIPWTLAFALREDGWWLRAENIWSKPNPMPESVKDRPTKSHEQVFILSKSEDYYYDYVAVMEQATGHAHPRGSGVNPKAAQNSEGSKQNASFSAAVKDLVLQRNRRSVWPIPHDEDSSFRFVADFLDELVDSGVPIETIQKVAEASWEKNPAAYLAAGILTTCWEIPTFPYPKAHFATFPPRIPELAIAAGTSLKGCCAACGAPLKRIVEKSTSKKKPSGWASGDRSHRELVGRYNKHKHVEDRGRSAASRMVSNTKLAREASGSHENHFFCDLQTVGWEPTCGCNCPYEPRPAVVADCFMGSGTTAEVACKMGRNFTGTELNPEYCKLIAERIGLFAHMANGQEQNDGVKDR